MASEPTPDNTCVAPFEPVRVSEAAPSVYHYLHLPEDQQQELLEFLRSI